MERVLEDTTSKIGYLSEMDLFQGLSREDMAWLDQRTEMVYRQRGQLLYVPEKSGEALFLLKRGRVQVYRLSLAGKKLVVAVLGPGAVFGEMSLAGQDMYGSFAEALEDVTLCIMRRLDVEQLLLAKPAVALNLLRCLSRRLLDSQLALEELAFKPVPARLASLLLRLWEEGGRGPVTGLSHQDLAEMVGALRETATEVLNHFKAAGLVEIHRMRVGLLDVDALREIAAG